MKEKKKKKRKFSKKESERARERDRDGKGALGKPRLKAGTIRLINIDSRNPPARPV